MGADGRVSLFLNRALSSGPYFKQRDDLEWRTLAETEVGLRSGRTGWAVPTRGAHRNAEKPWRPVAISAAELERVYTRLLIRKKEQWGLLYSWSRGSAVIQWDSGWKARAGFAFLLALLKGDGTKFGYVLRTRSSKGI